MSNYTVESFTVECSSDGVKLHTRVFKPASAAEGEGDEAKDGNNLGIVLVHPYSVLGGSQGLLKGIASGLALHGYTAVTFDMRGVGRSTGRPSLTGFAEVKDVVAVCNWVSHSLSLPRVLLVGSSAGITTQHNTTHLSDLLLSSLFPHFSLYHFSVFISRKKYCTHQKITSTSVPAKAVFFCCCNLSTLENLVFNALISEF